MKIIAPFKFWIKAVEIFFLQIPCFLIAFYFVSIAGILLSTMHSESTLVDKIIFIFIFIITNTLLFANYWDWGKPINNKKKQFLPSQRGLMKGFLMTLTAITTDLLIMFLIPAPKARIIGYELGALLARFETLSFGTILVLILWLYVASYLLYCISLLKLIKKY